jgi:hypothetical protein
MSSLNDEYIEIPGGWAVIYTDTDGWEIESQHDFSHYKLMAKSEHGAIRAAKRLANKIESRFQVA